MPSDLFFKTMNTVHRGLIMVSGGRKGWQVSGMPALKLTTTGRRTGRPRSVMLTSPLQDGAALVVVARVATADERRRLWPRVVPDHPRYGGYPVKTKREISLVLLTPVP
jgi:hypothetical protein